MADFIDYTGTKRFDNVQLLESNHFRFAIQDLPDLTFFAQTVTLPEVSANVVKRGTPFVTIPEVGDHLEFGALQVSYLVDNTFKSYFSLMYWLRGYGFPDSYDDIINFNNSRARSLGSPRPTPVDIQKTHGSLYILHPDSDTPAAEIIFRDLFPAAIGQLTFEASDGEPSILKTQVTFQYTDFEVRLT